MSKVQKAQALITAFINAYERVYGFKPDINRYRAKWGMVDVIDSVGYDTAKELIEYYFTCSAEHSVDHFMNTFDRLKAMMVSSREDARKRAALREETRKRMESLEQ